LSSLLLLGATVLLALWGIRRGLLPLQELTAQAGLVSTHDWELHVPDDAKQIEELRPLTQSMTTMLARLQRSFDQQREFLGNAAHELKTPVAVLKSTLQSLLQRPRASEEYRTGLEHSLEDLERLEQLLQWMLRLARAEQWAHGALRRDLQVIDVGATCEEAVERVRDLAKMARSCSEPIPMICSWSGSICWKTRSATVLRADRLRLRSCRITPALHESSLKTMAWGFRLRSYPMSSSAFTVEILRARELPEASAWGWQSRRLWSKLTEEPSRPTVFRAKARA